MADEYPKVIGYFVESASYWKQNWENTKGKMTFEHMMPNKPLFHPDKAIVEKCLAFLKVQGDWPTGDWEIYMISLIEKDTYKLDRA